MRVRVKAAIVYPMKTVYVAGGDSCSKVVTQRYSVTDKVGLPLGTLTPFGLGGVAPILSSEGGFSMRGSLIDRFWAKVNKDGPIPTHCPELGPCWPWTASCAGGGYGQLSAGKQGARPLIASRVSYEIHFGLIPEGLWVLHYCDNPPCVRPSHLFLGNNLSNMRDCAAKGRNGMTVHPEIVRRGEAHHNAKLTPTDVRYIREHRGSRARDLAKQYGVTHHNIYQIWSGRNWVGV